MASLDPRWILGILVGCWAYLTSAQPVQIQVTQIAGSIRMEWPAGLGWVQPQRQTDLAAPVWQDLGVPTTANTLSEIAGPTTGFYRLKLLPPTITQQPTAKSVAAGADVTLQVGVMGTEPMAYQWYKGNVRLTGKTGAQLALSGVTSADGGNYSVWITNRAGTAASQGALLTVTTPTVRPSGIYMGNFSGQSDNGGFAAMIRSDGTAFVVGYNTPQEEGVFIPTWTLPADGNFTIKTVQKGTITGVFTSSAVSGTFSNSTGQSGAFSGNRKPDSGIHAKSAGYYVGTYDGAASGSAYAIIAADGSLFFYSVDNPLSPTADGDGGGFGVINAANALSGTTVPNGFQLQGMINPNTGVLTGTYSLGGTELGTFRVVRTQTP
jgi:hypothetical protein